MRTFASFWPILCLALGSVPVGVPGVRLPLAVAALTAAAVPAASAADEGRTVLETLDGRGEFARLLEALQGAGLADELAAAGPVTVFAPTDDVLLGLPPETLVALGRPENGDELRRLLRYHVAPGRWTLEEIGLRAAVDSLEGGELRLRMIGDGAYSIDVARLTETDIVCSDGIVHVVDAVLLPPGLEILSDADLYEGGVHRYDVDAEHSTIMFRVMHMNVGAAYGWFDRFKGEVVVDAEDPSNSSIVLAVEVASIDTRNAARDDYLQTADFFDAERHPVLTFRSTSVEPSDDGALQVDGELSLRGVSKPVAFEARRLGQGRFGPRTYKVGYEAQLTFRRSDFGMTYGIPGVAGDEVELTIALEANRPLDG